MPYWKEITHGSFSDLLERTNVAVLPTGALEGHGNHLPLGTDIILPEYLADIIAQETNALVLPTIPFGDSWIFKQFAGTISIEPTHLVSFYQDVMNSVFEQGIHYLVVLNGHGGNSAHIETAAKRAADTGDRVVIVVNWWRDLAKEVRAHLLETYEGHAAEDETSEVMFVAPSLVKSNNMVPARVSQKFKIISGQLREELIPHATFGDPRSASQDKGKAIIEQAAKEIIELVNDLERGVLPVHEESF